MKKIQGWGTAPFGGAHHQKEKTNEYEIREASRCVKLGRTGSDRYTPQDSLALTRLMYDTRMSWGMRFVGEV